MSIVAKRFGCVLALLVAICVPSYARAADVGRTVDIIAVRHDVPALLAARVRASGYDPAKDLRIEAVAISGEYALVQWRYGANGANWGVEGLIYIRGRWRDRMTTTVYNGATIVQTAPPLKYTDRCTQFNNGNVLSKRALLEVGFPESLVDIAEALPAVLAAGYADARATPTPSPGANQPQPTCDPHGVEPSYLSPDAGR